MSTAPSALTTTAPPTRRPLTKADLFDEASLADKEFGTDYCLLIHSTDATAYASIMEQGLKSIRQLAEQADAPESLRSRYRFLCEKSEFKNDPTKIHTRVRTRRPGTTQTVGPELWDSSVVLACHPDVVTLYNEQIRDYGPKDYLLAKMLYEGTAMPLSRYVDLSGGDGTMIDKYGYVIPRTGRDGEERDEYWPEVVIDEDLIDPSFFITSSEVLNPHRYKPWSREEASTAIKADSTTTRDNLLDMTDMLSTAVSEGVADSGTQTSRFKSWTSRAGARARRGLHALSDRKD